MQNTMGWHFQFKDPFQSSRLLSLGCQQVLCSRRWCDFKSILVPPKFCRPTTGEGEPNTHMDSLILTHIISVELGCWQINAVKRASAAL